MEQDKVRGMEAQENIWQRFAGKRLVLAGVDGPEYQAFFQSLAGISSRTGAGFRVVDGVENVLDGDYVLLFARPSGGRMTGGGAGDGKAARRPSRRGNPDWEAPFDDPSAHYSWRKAPGSVKAAGEDWRELLGLLPQLRALTAVHPEAVLVISGNEVYGKCFGVPHALKEAELGYLSHTDCDDAAAQCLRTAEHFACQLAAEQKLPVRVVRMGALGADEAVPPETLEACARVLLCGEDAQIYNLPGEKRADAEAEEVAYDTEHSYIAQMNRRQRGSAVKEPVAGNQMDWQDERGTILGSQDGQKPQSGSQAGLQDGQEPQPGSQAGLQDGQKTMPGGQTGLHGGRKSVPGSEAEQWSEQRTMPGSQGDWQDEREMISGNQDERESQPGSQSGLQDGWKTMPGSQKSGKIVRFRAKENDIGKEETPSSGRFGASGMTAAQQKTAGRYPECGSETAGQPAGSPVGQPAGSPAGQSADLFSGRFAAERAAGRGYEESADGSSPLAPIAIVTDTEKVDRLGK